MSETKHYERADLTAAQLTAELAVFFETASDDPAVALDAERPALTSNNSSPKGAAR